MSLRGGTSSVSLRGGTTKQSHECKDCFATLAMTIHLKGAAITSPYLLSEA